MLIQDPVGIQSLEAPGDFSEARVEAIGYIFHGNLADSNGKRPAARATTNLLHFARCMKLEKVGDDESKIWFRSIRLATKHLDEVVGKRHWKWCKVCEREITQRILDET